jgi:hypothetical protein
MPAMAHDRIIDLIIDLIISWAASARYSITSGDIRRRAKTPAKGAGMARDRPGYAGLFDQWMRGQPTFRRQFRGIVAPIRFNR